MEPIVKRNTNRDTEREHLNKILKWVAGRLDSIERNFGDNDQQPSDPGTGDTFSLSVDSENFNFTNVEGNSYYLDLAAEGVGTNELANLSVTYDKIDFTTFDSDDVVEGTVNLYFSNEKAQDAVGMILDPGSFVDLTYDDVAASIVADLSASGAFSSATVLRGDNTWARGVTSDWTAGSYIVGNVRYVPISAYVTGEINVAETGVDYGAVHTFLTGSGEWDITGIIGGDEGRVFTISNDPSSTGSLFLDDSNATFPLNNIKTPTGLGYEIAPGNSVTLMYVVDATLADPGYWIFTSTTASGGGGGAGTVESLIAGDGIAVDSTDPANPVVTLQLHNQVDDIVADAGDLRFILDKQPFQDRVSVYDDGGARLKSAMLTGSGLFRYLTSPASGGEVYTVDYWTLAAGPVFATVMDDVGEVYFVPVYPNGAEGVAYDYTPSPAVGGVGPYTYSYTGTLPDGLTFDTSDGRLYGTPTVIDVFNFTVYAEDDNGVLSTGSSQALEITVAGDIYWANVSSLLYGTSISDDETGKTWTAPFGDVISDSTHQKFGMNSIQFTSGSGQLQLADDGSCDFGAGDFTIQFWLQIPSTGAVRTAFSKRTNTATYGGVLLLINGASLQFLAYLGGGWDVNFSTASVLSSTTWHEVGIRRLGNVWSVWVDNVQVGSAAQSGTIPDNSDPFRWSEGGMNFCNIAQARITKGIARDLSIPQTAPWPNY